MDQERAAAEGAPLLYPEVGSNVVSTRDFVYGDPEAAFAGADRTVKLKVRYPRNSQTPLEGFVVVADHSADDNAYDVASNFQGPYTTHPVMARALKVPSSRLRLRTPAYSGGGFGVKVQIFPYVVLMCLASKKAGAGPVKWVEDRLEHLSAAAAAPNRVIEIEAAVTNDGRVTAFRFDQLDDYGAYLRAPMPGPLYRMHGIMNGAYDIQEPGGHQPRRDDQQVPIGHGPRLRRPAGVLRHRAADATHRDRARHRSAGASPQAT